MCTLWTPKQIWVLVSLSLNIKIRRLSHSIDCHFTSSLYSKLCWNEIKTERENIMKWLNLQIRKMSKYFRNKSFNTHSLSYLPYMKKYILYSLFLIYVILTFSPQYNLKTYRVIVPKYKKTWFKLCRMYKYRNAFYNSQEKQFCRL